MGIPLKKVAKRWMKEPGFKEGYDALEDEFALASQLIEARSRAGLTQAEVAEKMGTSQSTVARLESGGAKPSLFRAPSRRTASSSTLSCREPWKAATSSAWAARFMLVFPAAPMRKAFASFAPCSRPTTTKCSPCQSPDACT